MSFTTKVLTPAVAIHPGEILKDELTDRGMSQKEFVELSGISQTQLNEILESSRGIDKNIASAIGMAFKMDAVLWLNLQNNYEADIAKKKANNKIENSTSRLPA